jgi:mannose-6-phosphate isomerase-like protein (cupin superfamily)
MAGVEKRDFGSPDELRTPERTRVEVVHVGGTTAARLTMEPGWTWSGCVQPVVGTESCEHRHVGVVQSGRMRVKHDDGTVLDVGPGDAYVIEPGHDAEILGDERFVCFEFQPESAERYARG